MTIQDNNKIDLENYLIDNMSDELYETYSDILEYMTVVNSNDTNKLFINILESYISWFSGELDKYEVTVDDYMVFLKDLAVSFLDFYGIIINESEITISEIRQLIEIVKICENDVGEIGYILEELLSCDQDSFGFLTSVLQEFTIIEECRIMEIVENTTEKIRNSILEKLMDINYSDDDDD